ncbi:hypothetical protein ACFQ41_09760 [Lacticaseibacillus suilingensis]|jgi:peptidoglycan hydrolase CwlO-like protein|uniref:TcdA-E operon negative regulator n=1 Tax=Lacticaseibacillus suilingensis TaxID=2799577 RepID=A0ABW4BGG2_9LACO|nr:hypothetical protein [Lacticaseibacillus suilingensis]
MKKYWGKFVEGIQSEIGVLIATLVFPPLGIFLVWKTKRFSKEYRIVFTVLAVLVFVVQFSTVASSSTTASELTQLTDKYNHLSKQNKKHLKQYQVASSDYSALSDKYDSYHQKMKPYEALSEADAKKRQADADAADKVTSAIEGLPTVDTLASKDEGALKAARTMYNALTASQKELVDATTLTELEQALPGVKKKEAEDAAAAKAQAAAEAAAKAKAAEEERKGYETGITYSQLARTPDSYVGKKVKFSGEVAQVMEDGDTVQARLAVNGDYDNMLLCEWSTSTVSSRVLEDDQITIYGLSEGLITYESTLGGDITIPSVSVDKIGQ